MKTSEPPATAGLASLQLARLRAGAAGHGGSAWSPVSPAVRTDGVPSLWGLPSLFSCRTTAAVLEQEE